MDQGGVVEWEVQHDLSGMEVVVEGEPRHGLLVVVAVAVVMTMSETHFGLLEMEMMGVGMGLEHFRELLMEDEEVVVMVIELLKLLQKVEKEQEVV